MNIRRTKRTRFSAKPPFTLVPLIVVMYIAAFLNRVNVGFAALTMNQDLGFHARDHMGFAAGIFFLGYFLFEPCPRT